MLENTSINMRNNKNNIIKSIPASYQTYVYARTYLGNLTPSERKNASRLKSNFLETYF